MAMTRDTEVMVKLQSGCCYYFGQESRSKSNMPSGIISVNKLNTPCTVSDSHKRNVDKKTMILFLSRILHKPLEYSVNS